MTYLLGLTPVLGPVVGAEHLLVLTWPHASNFFPWALNLAHGWGSLGLGAFLSEPDLGCFPGLVAGLVPDLRDMLSHSPGNPVLSQLP